VVGGDEEVHGEAEVAALRPGEHGRAVRLQVEGASASQPRAEQEERGERGPSRGHDLASRAGSEPLGRVLSGSERRSESLSLFTPIEAAETR